MVPWNIGSASIISAVHFPTLGLLMMDFDDHDIPDAAFTEDELEAGVQHLVRGAKMPSASWASSEPTSFQVPNMSWHRYHGAARDDRYRTYRLGITEKCDFDEDLFLTEFDLSLRLGGFGEIRYLVELFYTKSGISPDFGWSFLTEVLTLTPEQRKQLQLNLKVQLDLHYERRQMIEQVEWESRVSVLREARALLAEQIHLDET